MSPGELAELWSAGKSAADRAVLHGDFGVWLHRAAQEAQGSSIDGWTDDDIALFHSPRGFDPASISIPVKVWHGRVARPTHLSAPTLRATPAPCRLHPAVMPPVRVGSLA